MHAMDLGACYILCCVKNALKMTVTKFLPEKILSLLYLNLLNTLQHPGMWHKCNGKGLHGGLAALTGCNESLETVNKVGVDCGVF